MINEYELDVEEVEINDDDNGKEEEKDKKVLNTIEED